MTPAPSQSNVAGAGIPGQVQGLLVSALLGILGHCPSSQPSLGFPGGSDSKTSACMQETHPIPSLGQEDPLEKEMAAHSSILTWVIPWTEEPGGL